MFLDKDFLLNTETARVLYHEAAASCPIIVIPASVKEASHAIIRPLLIQGRFHILQL